jgi:protein-S-isoprenylcysteine O-methyltransferase Ste14
MRLVAPLSPQLAIGTNTRLVLAGSLFVVALAFDLAGLLAFRASRTTINPLAPERVSALVTNGVYRITRNPMYVGQCFILLAWGVYLSALLPFLGPIIYILYITRFQIVPEERVLRQLFGEQYAQYTARVRRWL